MSMVALHAAAGSVPERISLIDWQRVCRDLDARGSSTIAGLLTPTECLEIKNLYGVDDHFRSRVVMRRHNFGRGEYKYFCYPLPAIVADLRSALYPRLAPLANDWNEALKADGRYPATHDEFLARCHRAGQRRPTPLLLSYGTGDYNCLHQDIYGEQLFPLQVAILLSEPGEDFTGGELVLTEQRPRMQSRPEVISLGSGDAALFAVHQRPVRGKRGWYRVNMRHGVSRVHAGHRLTLGIIFHDAV